jgi:hypothetical protein
VSLTRMDIDPTTSETIPLYVSQPASIDLARATRALVDLDWLGSAVTSTPPGTVRRVAADLEMPITDGSSPRPVRKAAVIEVGLPRTVDGSVVVDIAWRSATLAPLFPVFAGRLVVTEEAIVLDGRYAPPLGRVGLLVDRGFLHFVARRTAAALLTRFSESLS